MASGRSTRSSTTPGGRPPPLRPIRDVTLSGGTTTVSPVPTPNSSSNSSTPIQTPQPSTRPKFAPNLAAAGRRQVSTPSSNSTTTPDGSDAGSSRGRGAGGRQNNQRGGGRGRGRGRGRYEPEIIQSKGIFSEGLAEADVAKRNAEYEAGGGGGGGGGGGSSFSRRQKAGDPRQLGKAGLKSEAVETDEDALKNLMRDNFVAHARYVDRVKPIILPLKPLPASWSRQKKEDRPDVRPDVVDLDVDIKPDLTSAASIETTSLPGPGIDSLTATLPPAFEELFRGGDNKSGQGCLFFVQLPNVIADMLVTTANTISQRNAATGLQSTVKAEMMDVDESVSASNGVEIKADPDADVTTVDISKETSSTVDESKTRKRVGQHALADIPHGRIGKLQLLKSGRVRLKLNEAVEGEPLIFDAAPGTKTTFLQQVVSIKTNNQSGETNESGELFVLGDISHRLLLTPKIDNLLSSLKRASR